jgi:hypothetical protein
MRIIAIFTALLAVAFAAPGNLEARQQGEACEVCVLVDNQLNLEFRNI